MRNRYAERRHLVLIGLGAVLLGAGGCAGRLWSVDLQSGLRRAQQERKLVLVEFTQIGCKHTSRMHREAFTDPDVTRLIQDFVPVRLDKITHAAEAERWGLTRTPTYLIARPNGTLVSRFDGAMSADAFRRFLIRARISQ